MKDYLFGAVLGVSLAFNAWHVMSGSSGLEADADPWIGVKVDSIQVIGEDGGEHDVVLAGADRPTVLYAFRDSCSWCTMNRPALAALMNKVSGQYRFIHLSTEPLVQPAAGVYVIAPSTRTALELGTTPETIVLGQDGVIQQRWSGAYAGRTGRSVEAFFGISLPTIEIRSN